MAYEAGGYADKLGNRFELRWVVRQYLQVLAGELQSVTLESVGNDEQGVDLWIMRRDGRREAQQCKGELASKSCWTMADLHHKGILQHLKEQLERGKDNAFSLVSATPATFFRDIARSARDSTGDSVSFYRDQIQNRSKDHRHEFANFCKYLGLTPDRPDELAVAFDLLRRSDFHHFCDDWNTRAEMRTLVSLLIAGAPENILSALATFAWDNLRKTVHADDLLSHLRECGFEAKDLAHDDRLLPRIEELRRHFDGSMRQQLASGKIIPRSETKTVVDQVEATGSNPLIMLHGPAGVGKSGVLLELATELERLKIPFLPLRLDRQTPQGSARSYGISLGLPDSPVACLRALAGERRAVLILDQLDALRWTSSHAASALPICEDLIRQAMVSPNIKVVLTCRTFDLDHDPQLKAWQHKHEIVRVGVSSLTESVVKEFVTSLGVPYDEMTLREQRLLRSIHNLTMWSAIIRSSGMRRFTTVTQLTKLFWENRRQELASRGVDLNEVNTVLDTLAGHMDQNARLTAPERLVERHVKAVAELQSLNVIQVLDGRVSFCHQAYLDYLVAVNLLSLIDTGTGSVLSWLGDKARQSLFRREQLRLVLTLIREEDPVRFIEGITTLIANDHTRFHLKHLSLQLLAQVDEPNQGEIEFVASLLSNDSWREHVLDQFYSANPRWFEALDERGQWSSWLASSDDKFIGSALWALRSAATRCGDRVANLLAPYVSADGDWPRRCLSVLPREPSEESNSLVHIRLQLAHLGFCEPWVDWVAWARHNPLSFVDLLIAYIDHHSRQLAKPAPLGRHSEILDSVGRVKDLSVFKTVGKTHPVTVWDGLLSVVVRFTRRKKRLKRHWRERQARKDPINRAWRSFSKLPGVIQKILVSAGRELLRRDSDDFFRRISELKQPSHAIQRIVANSLLAGGADVADRALKWIIDHPSLLHLRGSDADGSWVCASRLIRRFAPNCSDCIYRRLEGLILSSYGPEEADSIRWKCEQAKQGFFDTLTLFGQTQYHLLPALPDTRKSGIAKGMEGVLSRKFDPVAEQLWRRDGRAKAGFVGSPIPADRLPRLSNAAWMRIICDARPRRRYYPRVRADGNFTESSARMFARDLHSMTCRQPQRFAQLGLLIPSTANPAFLEGVLTGLETLSPPESLSDEMKRAWEPATAEQIELLLKNTGGSAIVGQASAFSRLIARRADANWSHETVQRLITIAVTHEHPGVDEYVTHGGGDGQVGHLELNAINVTRGIAVGAIEQLLWKHPDWLPLLDSALDAVVKDPHPAVRVAAIGACVPVLNIDRDRAVKWFVQACNHEDEHILGCQDAAHFLAYAARTHFGELRPVILRMINSPSREIQKAGAAQAAAMSLTQLEMQSELEQCLAGADWQRAGVAIVARDLVENERFSDRCRELLNVLFRDENPDVRRECNQVFYQQNILDVGNAPEFVKGYVSTSAFQDDPSPLLHALEEYSGSLLALAEVVLAICNLFSGPLADPSRDMSTGIAGDARQIAPLLLRLYEQAEGNNRDDIRQRCLDSWDRLLESRVGSVAPMMLSLTE